MTRRVGRTALALALGGLLLAGTARAGLFKNDTYKVGRVTFSMTLLHATLKGVVTSMRIVYVRPEFPTLETLGREQWPSDVKRRELATAITPRGSTLELSIDGGELPLSKENPDVARGGELYRVEYGVALTIVSPSGKEMTYELRAAPGTPSMQREWAHQTRLEKAIVERLEGVVLDAEREADYWNHGAANPRTGDEVRLISLDAHPYGLYPPDPETVRRQDTFDRLHGETGARERARASSTSTDDEVDRHRLTELALATVRAQDKFARDIEVLDMFPDGRGDPLYNPIWTCEVRYWTPSNYHDMQQGHYLKRDVYVRVDGTWRGAMEFKDLTL